MQQEMDRCADDLRAVLGGPGAPRLLVSVRDEREALAALKGGAQIIDIKEPSRGPLGMVDPARMAGIMAAVAGRAPVTAALGELSAWDERTPRALTAGLGAVKVGLAGEAGRANWGSRLALLREQLGVPLVAAAYVDSVQAHAPSLESVFAWALEHAAVALLLDTAHKNGLTLLDHLPGAALGELVRRAHEHGLPVAAAGSIGTDDVGEIAELGVDVIAVRGAACAGGDRRGAVCADRVGRLRELIEGARPAPARRAG